MKIDIAFDVRADLGEGPIWDSARQRLVFVDIMRGDVHEYDPETDWDAIFEIGQPVGAVVPARKGDWIAAVRDGFLRLDPATGATWLAAIVEEDRPDNRM